VVSRLARARELAVAGQHSKVSTMALTLLAVASEWAGLKTMHPVVELVAVMGFHAEEVALLEQKVLVGLT